MPLSDFRSVGHFQVPFCDIDMFQHVNNASYVVWAETSRCVYFDEVLGVPLTGARSIILAKLEITYERPLEYREHVAVASRVTRIGNKSYDLLTEYWSEDSGQRAAFCTAILVGYNYETKQTIVIPQEWRERIAAYEVVKPQL
ncbi:thioesterase superfamily [Candidatus Koribacter versatilis Ellin345]|uniref:Thioesterase superfamily n=1 Tax=Koribacter versatilis (strain Ellin345) TaxID=204669 RepID=Q1IV38_KORVE|nr:acyl-CoA thioesterase [Candidatus Koribacter versatilis]ABF39262.1 thioesterase superfamily [Candidatus Koribacter versatilis Ellin345]